MKNSAWGVLLWAGSAFSATYMQGPLSNNTTWTLSGSPYVLTGDVTVPLGKTLTLEPGVVVLADTTDNLASGYDGSLVELLVQGTLQASGTNAQPVVFTTTGGIGGWAGIYAAPSATVELQQVLVEKAFRGLESLGRLSVSNARLMDGEDSCLVLFGGQATVSSTTFQSCGSDAVYVSSAATLSMSYSLVLGTRPDFLAIRLFGAATLTHNTVTQNGLGGIDLLNSSLVTLRDNIVAQNGAWGVRRRGTGAVVFEYNNVFGHATDLEGNLTGSGNLSKDPLFMGLADFRLKPNSPCRGTGSLGSDMGAYSYSQAIARIVVAPTQVTLPTSGSATFTATAYDASNVVVSTPFTWSVTPGVGTVSSTGVFTAGCTVGSFPGALVVSAQGQSAAAEIQVAVGPVASLTVQPQNPTLPALGTRQFTAQGSDACGNGVAVNAAWSAVPASGSITPAGLFTASASAGTYNQAVTATAQGLSTSTSVTVTSGPVKKVVLTPKSVMLPPSGKQTFTAVAQDASGAPLNVPIVFSVLAGGGTISATGTFTAGNVAGVFPDTVVATAGGLSERASVTVVPGTPLKLVVSPPSATVSPLGVTAFSAQVFDAFNNIVTAPVSWAVTPPSAGSISSSGLFTAGSQEGVFVDAVKATSGSLTGQASLTVKMGALAKLRVVPEKAKIRAGGSLAFTVVAQDASGNVVPVTPVWAVRQGGGTLDTQGVFTAITTPGVFPDTVQVVVQGASATASVEVVPGPATQIQITPAYPEVSEKERVTFAASLQDGYGNDVGPVNFVWTADENAGTISPSGEFQAASNAGDFPNAVRASAQGFTQAVSVRILPSQVLTSQDAGTPPDALTDVSSGPKAGCGCSEGPSIDSLWLLGLWVWVKFRRNEGTSESHP